MFEQYWEDNEEESDVLLEADQTIPISTALYSPVSALLVAVNLLGLPYWRASEKNCERKVLGKLEKQKQRQIQIQWRIWVQLELDFIVWFEDNFPN